jgi:hypothetical protein
MAIMSFETLSLACCLMTVIVYLEARYPFLAHAFKHQMAMWRGNGIPNHKCVFETKSLDAASAVTPA